MNNKKHVAEDAINEFYAEYSGNKKNFKIFSINNDKGRTIITLSSAKKNDDFIEYGFYKRNYKQK